MSLKAITWVFEENVRPASLKLVLIALADNAGATAEAWPSIAVIAQKASLSRRQVIRALHELEKRGLILDTGRRIGPTKQVKIYSLGGGWEAKGDNLSPVTSTTERVTPTARKGDSHVTRNPIEPKEPEYSLQKPTGRDEVRLYFRDNLKLDGDTADDFFDHFENNGWRIGGRTPMLNWHLAANRWKRKLPEFTQKQQANVRTSTHQQRNTRSNRNDETLNAGKSGQYRGLGKVVPGVSDQK